MSIRLSIVILLSGLLDSSFGQTSVIPARAFKSEPLVSCNNWLYLPSKPSYVNIGDLDVPGNQITVEAEINRTTPYVGGNLYAGDIVSKHQGPSDINYLLRPNSAEITTADGVYHITPPVCDIELNKTYHVALVYDGTTLKFYRNGFLLSQIAVSGNLFQNDYNTQIGIYQAQAFNENFIGYINEVRIWNVARTQAQIQAYMNTSLPSPGTQTGLLAYYTFDDLINKQGNSTWNGTIGGSAVLNQTNPTCAAFVTDDNCCPALQGTLTGNSICPGRTGYLTFHSTGISNPPFNISYSDGVSNYIQYNVQDGVPFAVAAQPASTTNYSLVSIQDASGCAPTTISGPKTTIIVNPVCDRCDNWLNLPSNPSYVAIGDLDIPGNQITVEAEINMILPFSGGPTLGSDIVAKYADPSDANYLLRAQNAQITTTNGFFKTPDACSFELNKTYHVAMVYDGSTLKYYRNGFLVSQIAATGNLIQNNWPTQIGFYQFAFYNTNFIGYINEVRIWNVARTQAQIQAFMNSSLPSPATQTGLLAYYTFDDLLNKQGNPAWNGTLGGAATINQTNPTCASFVPDNICCPVLMGTINGNSICPGKSGTLTFHSTATSNPPYTITYSDGITNYVQNNVQDGVPFSVAVQPSVTTNYSLVSIQDAGACPKTNISGPTTTITVTPVCDHCNNWLDLPAQPAYVQVGNLNVTGNQITVEAEINRTTPYAIGTLEEGDIVSKHDNPGDVNYLLRPNHAYITTTNGYYGTHDICDIQLNKTYHIAMVYDGTTLKFYRNGFLMSQVPATGNLFQNAWPTRIGYYFNQAYNENFIGFINEVRIWNVARTQAQIQAYMNTSLPSPATQTGLLAYYTFDDLLNKQGNAAWNGALGGSASINKTNPTCAAFVADNDCCPKLAGNFTGNSICPGGTGVLSFHPTTTPLSASYTITYSDDITGYVQNNVQDGVPFPVPVQPAATAKYALLKITNAENCATDITGDTAIIVVKNLPQPSFTADQDVCNPFQVKFYGITQAGTVYDWNINGVAYPNSLNVMHDFGTAGVYPVSLTVSQAGGCVNSLSRNINVSLLPSDIITTSDTTICFGDSIRLKTKSALEYCWLPDVTLKNPASRTPEVKPLSSTQYFVNAKVRGPNLVVNGDFSQGNTGFLSNYTLLTSGNQEGTYTVAGNPASWDPGFSNCADHTGGNGNMLLVNGSTVNLNVIWSEVIPVQTYTDYHLSAWFQLISSSNNAGIRCYINGVPLEDFYYSGSTPCNWQEYLTEWNSGGSMTATIVIVNTYADVAGNDFALDDISFTRLTTETDAIRVNVDKPSLLASTDTTICPGASVPLWASGLPSFSWSPATSLSDASIANPIAAPQGNTAYIVTGRSSLGCLAKDTVQVSIFLPVPVTITPDTSICINDAVQLIAAGGLSYSWSPAAFLNDPSLPDPIAKPDGATRFILNYKDMNSCMEKDSVSVSFRPIPEFKAPPDRTVCKGFSVLLGSDNDLNFIYEWSPADHLNNPSSAAPAAFPDHSVSYRLKISDPVCDSYDSNFSVFVNVKPSPTVITQKSNDINCSNLFTQLKATGAASYSWLPVNGLNNAQIANPVAAIDSGTTYVVRGTSENGCYADDSVTVNVKPTGKNLFSVPNAFTPNHDGMNDCFGIRKWGDVTIKEFSVYNRWGQRVFDTRTPGDCWNGTFHGEMQDTGQYVYVIQAVSFCGNITRSGTVLLIR